MIRILTACALLAGTQAAFARQSLQAAMVKNPKLSALVDAAKEAAGVDCLTIDSTQTVATRGPEGKQAVTQYAACFDPLAFNPTQLGQLEVTYYGSGEDAKSDVGTVIEVKFEFFK